METTEFMLHLIKQLMDERKVAESTANAYIKSLYALNGKKSFKNLTFLKDTEAIDAKIAEYAETTQRALLATIVSVLSLIKNKPTFKKVFNHYYEAMMKRSEAVRAEEGKNEKSEKQRENWISWKQIEERKGELKEEVEKASKGKTATLNDFEKILQYVVLSIYTDIQPRRNQDYLDMYIVKKWNDKMPQDKNYLDMTSRKFIFHKYKTAKKHGTQTHDIPDSLWDAINKYLKYHPLWKGVAKRKNDPVKFLVGFDGAPLTAVNAITRILNRIFGKKIGSSLLRHIYISDKYGDLIEEQKEDAEAMGHSVAQQRDYYKRDDSPPKNEIIEHA
jgi:integrase